MALGRWYGRVGGLTAAVAVCAVGRAFDFATTWVAIGMGRAAESQPFATHVFQILGQHTGMIAYEAMITTPLIFLGCRVAKWAANRNSPHWLRNAAEHLFFAVIGAISLIVAVLNVRYLL
jgi:uncharacterized membrane protein YedE/YeeE